MPRVSSRICFIFPDSLASNNASRNSPCTFWVFCSPEILGRLQGSKRREGKPSSSPSPPSIIIIIIQIKGSSSEILIMEHVQYHASMIILKPPYRDRSHPSSAQAEPLFQHRFHRPRIAGALEDLPHFRLQPQDVLRRCRALQRAGCWGSCNMLQQTKGG